MSATATKPAPVGSQWKHPEVEVGDVVHWYPDDAEDQKPFAAIVSSVGIRGTLCLSIINPNSYNFMVRDGVRHRGDPFAKTDDLRENGFWQHTPKTNRLLDAMAKS